MKLIDFWSWTYMAIEARRPLNLDWRKDIFNLGLPPTQTASVSSHRRRQTKTLQIHSLIYFERHTNTDRQTHKDRHTERTLHIWPISISEVHFQSGPPSNPRKPLLSVPTHADRQKHLQSKICTHRDAHTHTLKQKEQSRFSIDETHPSFCLTDKLPA